MKTERERIFGRESLVGVDTAQCDDSVLGQMKEYQGKTLEQKQKILVGNTIAKAENCLKNETVGQCSVSNLRFSIFDLHRPWP